jgi:uncharacterized protein (UPF0333 family)
MIQNEKGHSVLMVVLAIVTVAVIGAVGYFVYDRQFNKDVAKNTDTTAAKNKTNISDNSESKTTDDNAYVEVREWGVKVGVGTYKNKVSVSKPNNYGIEESDIVISVKPAYDFYADCTTEIKITRLKDVSDFDSPPEIKLGDYYYYNSGVGECGGAKESGNSETISHDDLIKQFNSLGVKSL